MVLIISFSCSHSSCANVRLEEDAGVVLSFGETEKESSQIFYHSFVGQSLQKHAFFCFFFFRNYNSAKNSYVSDISDNESMRFEQSSTQCMIVRYLILR